LPVVRRLRVVSQKTPRWSGLTIQSGHGLTRSTRPFKQNVWRELRDSGTLVAYLLTSGCGSPMPHGGSRRGGLGF
jgi:hypothetical protein